MIYKLILIKINSYLEPFYPNSLADERGGYIATANFI
jgi:hypothetical protein